MRESLDNLVVDGCVNLCCLQVSSERADYECCETPDGGSGRYT